MNLDTVFDSLLAEILDRITKHIALGPDTTTWNHFGSGKNRPWEPILAAEAVIKASGAKIVVDNDANTPAYFCDKCAEYQDTVVLFSPERYECASYYSTVFHELGHWTGDRLKRQHTHPVRPKQESAIEEMTAEFTAAFICAALNIVNNDLMENQAIYVAAHFVYGPCTDSDLTLAVAQAKEAAAFLLNKAEWPSLQIAA